MQDNTDAKIT